MLYCPSCRKTASNGLCSGCGRSELLRGEEGPWYELLVFGQVLLTVLVVVYGIFWVGSHPHHCGGHLTVCKSNLKNIGTALEMYSTDNGGSFPASLSALTPNYLKAIPSCPGAGRDTYTKTYRVARSPDAYTLCCRGKNHEEAAIHAPGYPEYTSREGLIERP